ncbi:MAG: DUF1254 domain-containing protein [Rhizobiaceae bacterium]|nr:DUF1254 domain-containing protein [Rhizobiaceae bacterium]
MKTRAQGRHRSMLRRRSFLAGAVSAALPVAIGFPARGQSAGITAAEARAIAQEAVIYGFPMVDSYRIQYSYFVDKKDPEYKGDWNKLFNTARVYTPDDKAVQTPNSDTPYSFIGADLRAEPLVFTVPEVEKGRYYSIQFIDMYTFNFAYVGSRATGNEAGKFLLAGPDWKGETPPGIKEVIRSETELALALYRTQLFNPADIENVKKIQARYKVEPLSAFLGTPPPAPAPKIAFIKPLPAKDERTSLRFFAILNFILQFCPTNPAETDMMARFAKIGVGAGKTFDPRTLPPGVRKGIEAGMADAWTAFTTYKKTELDTGKRTSANGFGTRAFLNGDYMARMSAAALGIYGNSKEEAIYPIYFTDSSGKPLTGSSKYSVHFAADGLPPVNAFWSLTLYKLPSSLLSANPLHRYLINSSMLPDLKRDADGGITIYVQNASPGKDKESNWLPAPDGPFFIATRLYWPKPDALDGKWKAPPLEHAS